MSLNIAGTQSIDDPEYRYKMPRLVAKIEGRGNGIKTVIMNCVDIAYSLHRSAPEITKFFGCELGAQSKYDEKTERSVVNGAFDAGTMQQHLSKFIEIFVLCPSCRLPETKYKFKGHSISHKCAACGAINLLDMNHKLTTYILKDHAANKRNRKEKKDDKKKRREKKEKGTSDPADDGSHGSKSPTEKDKKEKLRKKKKEKEDDTVEVEWHTDLSKEAVAARAQEAQVIEAAALKALEDLNADDDDIDDEEDIATLDNCHIDDSGAIANAVNSLKAYLKVCHNTEEIIEEVKKQQTFAALSVKDRLVIFFKAAVGRDIIHTSPIRKYSEVFKKIICTAEDQYTLMACCEVLCAVSYPELSNCLPVIFKMFYDEDILEEEKILEWMKSSIRNEYSSKEIDSIQAKALLTSLKPFIEWLENAEEESEDDE